MVAIGSLMFLLSLVFPGVDRADMERPLLQIPKHRIEEAIKTFSAEGGGAPTPEEYQTLLDNLINQEVLYRYALQIGIDKDPAAQRRLAQIGGFVAQNPHEPKTQHQLAAAAMAMGLHDGDLVVRRILGDSARRLIRAVVLVRDPHQQAIEAYLQENPQRFTRPARNQLSQITINGLKHGSTSLAHAEQLLSRIRSEQLDIDAALALGDDFYLPSSLNNISHQSLQSRFGYVFADAIESADTGHWLGPIKSRYGYHLVFIHNRDPAYIPPLVVIMEQVAQALRQKLADEFLVLRLQQLRQEFDIVIPGVST